ncbi:hypothetical protein E4U56_001372, partial [Claviceps arundinis]
FHKIAHGSRAKVKSVAAEYAAYIKSVLSLVTRILTSKKHEEGDDNVQHIHRDDYKPEQHDGPSLNGNSEKGQREGSLAKGTRHDNEGL